MILEHLELEFQIPKIFSWYHVVRSLNHSTLSSRETTERSIQFLSTGGIHRLIELSNTDLT